MVLWSMTLYFVNFSRYWFMMYSHLCAWNMNVNWCAGLLVVSSKDEQPINRFVDLFNTDQLPSLLNDGAMDPKILKHYLLLHDNQDGTPERYFCLFLYNLYFICLQLCHWTCYSFHNKPCMSYCKQSI